VARAQVIVRELGAILLVACAIGSARAESQPELFAHFFSVAATDVKDVAGYRAPAGVDVTHILFGHFYEGAARQLVPGVVLLRCDERECRGRQVWLHPLDAEIEIQGLVDLREPGPLGESRGLERPRPGAWIELARDVHPPHRWGWPALAIALRKRTAETTSSRFGGQVKGVRREEELLVLSLRAADEERPELLRAPRVDLYPTGAGATTSYRLVRGGGDALDLVATEQREIESRSHCLRPAPVEYRLVLANGRYERRRSEPSSPPGCH
jgi:hypothetical protein